MKTRIPLKWTRSLTTACLGFVLLLTSAFGQSILPQRSTTGPVPPPSVGPKVPLPAPKDGGGAQRSIAGVPGYCWRHGCGPTAVGMVLGYYDTHGFPDLFPGDASTETTDVDQAIASEGSGVLGAGLQLHYEDYALPDDSPPSPILLDRSENYPIGCHQDDSVADFMHTSWSSDGNQYGASMSSRIAPAFISYVNMRNPAYWPRCSGYYMDDNTLTWAVLTNEINNSRPMVFLVDSDGDGQTDHFVTVIAYSDNPTQQYGCLDTWNPCSQIRWCNFKPMSSSYSWGVWGGWSFALRPPASGDWPMRDKDVWGSRNGGHATIAVDLSRYSTAFEIIGTGNPLIGDVLGDGNLELVAAAAGAIKIYDATGGEVGSVPTDASLACLADVDGDGKLEILAVQRDSSFNFVIYVFKGNGTLLKTVTVPGTGQSDQGLAPAFVADIDGDGELEIVSGLGSGYGCDSGGRRGLEVTSYATGQSKWSTSIGPFVPNVRFGFGNRVLHGSGGPANGCSGDDGTWDDTNYTFCYSSSGPRTWLRAYDGYGFFDANVFLPDLAGNGSRNIVATTSRHDWTAWDRGYGGIRILDPASGGDVAVTNIEHFVHYSWGAFGNLDSLPGDEVLIGTLEGTTPYLRSYGTDLTAKGAYTRGDGLLWPVGVADLDGDSVAGVLAVYRPNTGNDKLLILDGGLTQVLREFDFGVQYVGDVITGDLDQNGALEIVASLSPTNGPGRLVVMKAITSPVTIALEWSGADLVLTWPFGTLLSADQLSGPWLPVSGATSPWPVAPTAPRKFFRVETDESNVNVQPEQALDNSEQSRKWRTHHEH